jgi:cation:H+ antiporter
MLLFWIIVFVLSLFALIKGADWLLASAEKIGISLGLSSFVVGVLIVGIGTSFPELFSSLVAVLKGTTELVAANAIGSNIANILLIVGVSAIIGKKLAVTKNLIDIELPLMAISTIIFAIMAWDKYISFGEAVLLVVTYVFYMLYTVFHKDENEKIEEEVVAKKKVSYKDILLLILGIACLMVGSSYLVDSVIQISSILNVAVGVISITAVAIGTSLPELLVSVKAALKGDSGVALGNIFGSNAFNLMMVVGIPGLIRGLNIDGPTFEIGLPILVLATFIFIISGISKRIHVWEGVFYLSLYVLFIVKLFNLF